MEAMLLPVVIPGALGLLALLLPARLRGTCATLGVLGAIGTLVSGANLFGARQVVSWEWVQLGPLNLDAAFRVDGFSSWAVAFTGLASFLTASYSVGWFRGRGGAPGRFYACLLLATAGTTGALLADNLLLLVLFWEIVSLMLFFLVVSDRSEQATAAAAKAFTIVGAGDMALVVATVLIGVTSSSAGLERPLAMATMVEHPVGTGDLRGVMIFLLLFLGAATKAGAVPVHSWIPTMSTSAHPAVMALLPASLDKVLGIYLLVRISLHWCCASSGVRLVVMIVGVITILAAVLMAMVQHDLRRLLAFHAVSQVGYMVLGIGTATIVGVMGGIFHMLNNAIYKACLFLGAGAVEREAGTMRLDRLGGLARPMPVVFGAMLVAALAISGVPPLNGFVSKWLIYQGCVAAGQPLFLVAALFASVLTLASFVKALHSVFWGARPGALAQVREGGLALRLPLVVLASLCVFLGVLAALPLDWALGPALGLEPGGTMPGSSVLEGSGQTWVSLAEGVTHASAPVLPGASRASFRPAAVTGLLAVSVLAGLLIAYPARMRVRRVRPVFIGGEPLDPESNRFPGTEFYRTVLDLPWLGAALRQGEKGSFDVYQIGERLGGRIVNMLRGLHSGVLTDYTAWCLLGLTLLLAVFFWI